MQTYLAKIVCAWCKLHMGEKEGFNRPNIVTHSICSECAEKLRAEMDGINAPTEI